LNTSDSENRSRIFDFDIWDIWPILRKQRLIVALFFGTVVVATFFGVLIQQKEYQATALIHLTPRTGQEVASKEVVEWESQGYYEVMQFYRTQVHIMKSRTVREEVARRYMALQRDDEWQEFDAEGFEGGRRLGAALLVVAKEQSQLMNIHVTDVDPERAAILANLVSEVYSEQNLALRQGSAREAKKWLHTELSEYQKKIDQSNQALLDFKIKNDVVDIEENLTSLASITHSHTRRLGEVSTRRVVADNNLQSFDRLLVSKNFDELARVMESPLLNQLATDRAKVLQADADLAVKYGTKHPERKALQGKLKTLEASLESEVRKIIEGKRAGVQVVEAEEQSLRNELARLREDSLRNQALETEYRELKRELERNEKFHLTLSTRSDEVELSSRTQLNNVFPIDAAIPPLKHIRPNMPVSMTIAFLVGIIGGCALAMMREYIDDTISSHIDVASYLKVPFIGLVPSLPTGLTPQQADLFTHNQPRSSVAEAVRGLRAMIDLSPGGSPPKRLVVTSSVAREGKTSTITRLAVAYSQMGRKVVLIDADLRKPRVHKVFGADNRVGVTNYLLGAASVSDIIRTTMVPGVCAVYSGPATDHPTELLSSARIEQLLTDLEEHFDMILIDTPPSVALSDAVALSPFVDGVILVVREHGVSRHVVKRTVDTFKQVEANILGVILNNVDVNRGGLSYKYYYAYRDYYYNYTPRDDDDVGGAAAK